MLLSNWILKEDEKVVGYLLAMSNPSRNCTDVKTHVLRRSIQINLLREKKFEISINLIVGQVCLERNFVDGFD